MDKRQGAESVADNLLRRVVKEVGDPWFREAYEGFNDGCVFCDSHAEEMAVWRAQKLVSPAVRWHYPGCLWFDIHAHLGLEVDSLDRQRHSDGSAATSPSPEEAAHEAAHETPSSGDHGDD